MLFKNDQKKTGKLSRALGILALGAVAADVIGGLIAFAKIRKVTTDPDTVEAPLPEEADADAPSSEE